MNRRASPVYLIIATLIVTLGIAATEVAVASVGTSLPGWADWAFQIAPTTVRSSLIWMIVCFIAIRHGSTDWTTRTVPIGVGLLIVATHVLTSYKASFSEPRMDSIVLAAVGEIPSLVLASASVLVFSKMLNVSLRRCDCTADIAPQRITVQIILVATTCIAIFLALQNGVNDMHSNFVSSASGMRVAYLMAYVLLYICNASAFFGIIWAILSTRQRWIGIVGFAFWIVSPIAQICLLLSPEMQTQLPPGVVTTLLKFVIISQFALLVGTLLTIPVFRLFGYQFRIGGQIT